MKAGVTILTNNPRVREAFPDSEWVEGTSADVARKARDKVHVGWRLKTHPLAGSIRLLRSPYRSLALEEAGTVPDGGQVAMIEEAVRRLEKQDLADNCPESAEDYGLIDLDLLCRAMKGVEN